VAEAVRAEGGAAGQPVDHTGSEAAERRVLAAYFVECRTREVRGARITVYARPGLY
jgi:mannosyltransferase